MAITPNCGVCSVFPRAIVLSGRVGIFHFIKSRLFSTIFGQDRWPGGEGFRAGRGSFWVTPLSAPGVGWRVQDLPFSCSILSKRLLQAQHT